MSEIKLYIGDEYLDLSDSKSIPLNIQTQTIFKPAEVKGNFSRSFDIPRTDRNCRILQFAYDYTIDSDFPYQKIDAVLVVDGVEFSKGYVIVENNGLSEQEIKLTFYNGNSYFFNIINNLKLRDCKEFGLASHFWNDYYIFDFSNNNNIVFDNNPYYVYALVDYVGSDSLMYQSNGDNWLYASSLLPSLKSYIYKKAIEEATGYTLEGEIFNSQLWNQLIFPFGKDKLARRKADAESRINIDMEYWVQKQYGQNISSPSTPHKFELLKWDSIKQRVDSSATYTKYGNCSNVPYVNKASDFNFPTNLFTDSQGSIFAPDYTWSHFKLECKFTTDAIGSYQITMGDETNNFNCAWNDAINIKQSSLVISLTNSVTGQSYPYTIGYTQFGSGIVGFYYNFIKWSNLPKSYNTNQALNFDYILKIEFDFQTGLHRRMSLSFLHSMQLYVYYNKSSIRFLEFIEVEDMINYNHTGAFPWDANYYYGGKNVRVTKYGGIYELIDVNSVSVNQSPAFLSSNSIWNYIGLQSAMPQEEQIKLITENNNDDYYKVVYGGRPSELGKLNSIKNLNKGWITGADLVPDETIAWWIKGIANYLGCFIEVDDDNKKVLFKTWKEIYADIPNAYDYSNKVVNHKSSFWTSRNDGVGQKSKLAFNNSNFVSDEYGNYTLNVLDNSIPYEQTIINVPFSATENQLRFDKKIAIPYIKKISYDDNNGFPFYYKPKIDQSSKQHILLYKNETLGLINSTFPLLSINVQFSELLSGSSYIPTYATISQLFVTHFDDSYQTEIIKLSFDKYVFENYHRWLNYVFDNFKVLTCYMKLSPTDVNTIDKLKPIYINYYNSTFLLNRIYDWVNGEICKVELLKLN